MGRAAVAAPVQAAVPQSVSIAEANAQRSDRQPDGNSAQSAQWLAFLAGGPLQAKLKIGAVNDPLEREADAAADRVMGMVDPQVSHSAAPTLSRKCAACAEEKEEHPLRREAAGGGMDTAAAPPIVHDVINSPARPLDPATHDFMASRFGADFSDVRIHTDARAARSAAAVGARAYTVGRNVVFDTGHYDPVGDTGRRLLAHELAHVVQQGAAPVNAGRSPAAATHEGAAWAVLAAPLSRLQRQPKGGAGPPKTGCPPIETGEKEEAAKAQLRMIERIPQQEWLIYGFPIGGSEISEAESAGFIEKIVNSLMRGHFIYVTGQDPLEVLGFSDCFAGPQVDNRALRHNRAARFCAGVKDHFTDAPKSYSTLIRSCEAAAADQFASSNATRADRAHNRAILIRRVTSDPVTFQKDNQRFPYDPDYSPSDAHCAAYSSVAARSILGRVYPNNAHCSCKVTPDEPHNNCVRACLQDKMWNFLANESVGRAPNDAPMDINLACLQIWRHHRDCYHDCGCASEFIDYLAFDAVCNIPLPCAVDSAAINLVNRCMPATKEDKYLPVEP